MNFSGFSKMLSPATLLFAALPVLGLLGAAPARAEALAEVLGRTHVHGLAFDSGAGRLTLATHHGLYTVDPVSLEADPIGTSGHDFMGYSAVPAQPGVAFASGHPKSGGNLGIIRSEDGGVSWHSVSPGVGGPVDFHQLAVSGANPDVLYGIFGGAVQSSRDGGVTWSVTGQAPPKLIGLAASGRDAAVLYAATEAGLLVSRDDGADWQPALDGQLPVTMIDAGTDGVLHAFVYGQGLIRAEEGTGALDWQAVGPGPAPDFLLHFARDAAMPERLYGLTGAGAVVLTEDGGATWSVLAAP